MDPNENFETVQLTASKVDRRKESSKANVQKAIEARKKKLAEQKALREKYTSMFDQLSDDDSSDEDDEVYEYIQPSQPTRQIVPIQPVPEAPPVKRGRGRPRKETVHPPSEDEEPKRYRNITEYEKERKSGPKKYTRAEDPLAKLNKLESMMFVMMSQMNQPKKRAVKKVVKVSQGPTEEQLKSVVKESVENVKSQQQPININLNTQSNDPHKEQLKQSILKF